MDVNNPLKMVLIGIDPYPYLYLYGIYYYHCHLWFHMTHTPRPDWSPGRQPVMQDWLLMALLRRYVRDSPFGMWSNGLHWEYHNETVVSFFPWHPNFVDMQNNKISMCFLCSIVLWLYGDIFECRFHVSPIFLVIYGSPSCHPSTFKQHHG